MKYAVLTAFIFQLLFFKSSFGQSDTIKVGVQVSIISEAEMIADKVKSGDTLKTFHVTDDAFINIQDHSHQIVIAQNAPVIAIVDTVILPHKLKMVAGAMVYNDNFFHNDNPYRRQVGGQLVVRLIAVQSVTGAFIPLQSCFLMQVGGILGGYKNDRVMASILAGTRKVCDTDYAHSILILKRQ